MRQVSISVSANNSLVRFFCGEEKQSKKVSKYFGTGFIFTKYLQEQIAKIIKDNKCIYTAIKNVYYLC